jgi:[protein-PII] uridylyltransferase
VDRLHGRAWCRAEAVSTDAWLAGLFADALGGRPPQGIALVAVGGYGREELAPESDIDVLLLHDGKGDVGPVADRLWYPIWDTGKKLGHSVRTSKEALSLAASDLDTATSLLSARHLAGDRLLVDDLAASALGQWAKRGKHWLEVLDRHVAERHARFGDVAFLLEPELKEGRGGLRDIHALRWADATRVVALGLDTGALRAAEDVLLDVRVELHLLRGRPGDALHLEEQDEVAKALDEPDADALVARLSAAARTVAWISDEAWRRVESSLRGPRGRGAGKDRDLGDHVVLRDGDVHVAADADPATDPALVLRAAARAAEHATIIERASLDRLAAAAPEFPDPWPEGARRDFVELLLCGHDALPVIEALDQRGLWTQVLPEWAPVRNRPQRNAYHRFTVDRHLLEATANAADRRDGVGRPDLLVLGALLHDLGKGYPGDHTEVGMPLAATVTTRMGFPADDVATVVAMVEHHLLLPDVATRRDLADPDTAAAVAAAAGSVERLELLAALTEADSLATGPSAWGQWKADLVADLVDRAKHALGGDHPAPAVVEFPDAEQRALLAARELVVRAAGDTLTVVAPDRPGLFSRVAGTIALHGLDVRRADAHSTDDGMALAVFRVDTAAAAGLPWDRVCGDVTRALGGRLALRARVDERARRYARRAKLSARPPTTAVTVDNHSSRAATIVDVQTADGVGVLFRITQALADLDLDIRSATVQTLGEQVVDSFYVRDRSGQKVLDVDYLAEVERAVLAALAAGAAVIR